MAVLRVHEIKIQSLNSHERSTHASNTQATNRLDVAQSPVCPYLMLTSSLTFVWGSSVILTQPMATS